MRTYVKFPERRGCRLLLALIFFGVVSCLFILYFYCQEACYSSNFTSYTNSASPKHYHRHDSGSVSGYHEHFGNGSSIIQSSSLYNNGQKRKYNFNIEGDYVIVFLHMQKTGGTVFGKNLVKNIDLERPCLCYRDKKRCDCKNSKNNIWLVSRYSTGWSCGLHADWTELTNCVDSMMDHKEYTHRPRRYLYITILRDPYYRYISEWKHVQRGSTWISAELRCNGRQASLEEVPFCFEGPDWTEVTLNEFMECPHNLAVNRQTRMLANLSLVGCYNKSAMPASERDRIMLDSAKENLRSMAFFGLTEFQLETQYMFEHTFNLFFQNDFEQREQTAAGNEQLNDEYRESILQLNHLDVQLYDYAKHLFWERLKLAHEEDDLKLNNSTNL